MISLSDPGDQSMPSLFQMEAVRYFISFLPYKNPSIQCTDTLYEGIPTSHVISFAVPLCPLKKAYAGLTFLLYK